MRKVTVTFKTIVGTDRMKVVKATNTLQWKPDEHYSTEEVKQILNNNQRINFFFTS